MTKKWHLRGQIKRDQFKASPIPRRVSQLCLILLPSWNRAVASLRSFSSNTCHIDKICNLTTCHMTTIFKKKCTSKHVFENPSRNQPLDLPLSTRALSLLPALSGWCLGVSNSIQTLNMVSRFPNIHWLPTKTIHFYSFDGSLWDIPIWRISSWQIF